MPIAEKTRRLGKGLDALLGDLALVTEDIHKIPADQLQSLPTEVLQRGKYQPRRDIQQEGLQDLASSIRVQGVIQPIIVRKVENNRYEIIAGERRWRAAQMAGLAKVPVVVKNVADEIAMAMALIENIQRQDLNPIEEAMALQRLINEFDMTHEQIGETIGRSRTTVTNLLRLLGLHPEVKALLERGALEMGHARALLTLEAGQQVRLAQQVAAKQLSVRETENLVRRLQSAPLASTDKNHDPDIRAFQEKLSERLGAKVQIQHSASGKGKLTIDYNSLEELEGIMDHIK